MVEVTQADRGVIASYCESTCDYGRNHYAFRRAESFRRGEDDMHPLLQAFATHRIQSIAALQSELDAAKADIERLRMALGKVCEASNYDDPKVRNCLSSALDDVQKIATNAYYRKGYTHV